ncbi:MAG: hypothetical protein PHX08_08160 [Lachnospiraceae bacterium]|nr:hypothetical protein [Lachnospiraceae bacterium]
MFKVKRISDLKVFTVYDVIYDTLCEDRFCGFLIYDEDCNTWDYYGSHNFYPFEEDE